MDLGIGKSTFVMTNIARLVYQKGHDHLLRSVSNIGLKFNNIRLFIVGGGPYKRVIESKIAEYRVRNVELLGEREDVPLILAASDSSVLVSLREGFSNVILESMAAKTPVIATDVGGAREAIEDGVSGFIVASGDTASIERGMERLLLDHATARCISGIGMKKVENFFSIDRKKSLFKGIKQYFPLYPFLLLLPMYLLYFLKEESVSCLCSFFGLYYNSS
jgi:glycosyltransferase involved in cell wall biosynthesis